MSRQTASVAGGDVAVPIELRNPTTQARSYRVFISSTIGVDRQTLETAAYFVSILQLVP
jgi:hypothetical protein